MRERPRNPRRRRLCLGSPPSRSSAFRRSNVADSPSEAAAHDRVHGAQGFTSVDELRGMLAAAPLGYQAERERAGYVRAMREPNTSPYGSWS
jgi:hypothetical protein